MKLNEGEDFTIHFMEDITQSDRYREEMGGKAIESNPKFLLKCKKCTWEVDLNKLDTLLDFSDELEHHHEMCQTWSNHEAPSTH